MSVSTLSTSKLNEMKLFISLLLFAYFTLNSSVILNAQDDKIEHDMEIMSNKLVIQLNRVKAKKIIIEAFTTADAPTLLGVYLSDQLSYALLSNPNRNFDLIDKDGNDLQKGSGKRKMEDYGQLVNQMSQTAGGMQSTNNNVQKAIKGGEVLGKTIENLGIFTGKNADRIKGLDAIVKGTLTEYSDFFQLNVKVISTKKNQIVLAMDHINIAKTHDIIEMAKGTYGSATETKSMQLFKKNDLYFNLLSIKQFGQFFECTIEIENKGRENIDLYMNTDKSRSVNKNGGFEYKATTVKIADISNSNNIKKTLVVNSPVTAVITFTSNGDSIISFSQIEINCWAEDIGSFLIDFKDVPMK